jgi:hypothetical protein
MASDRPDGATKTRHGVERRPQQVDKLTLPTTIPPGVLNIITGPGAETGKAH